MPLKGRLSTQTARGERIPRGAHLIAATFMAAVAGTKYIRRSKKKVKQRGIGNERPYDTAGYRVSEYFAECFRPRWDLLRAGER